MSDIEQIFWILLGLTLASGTIWLRPGGVAFRSAWGWHPRPHWLTGRVALQNNRGGLLAGNLLPFSTSVVAAPWPLSVSPEGVVAFPPSAPTPDGRPDESGRFVAFADLRSATADGRTLVVNDRPFVTTQSKTLAARWARRLAELRDLPEPDRAARIDRDLAASCDPAAARAAVEATLRRVRWVRRLSAALCTYCFLVIGLAAFGGPAVSFQAGIGVYAGLIVSTYLAFRLAARAATPDEPAPGHGWMILISPADAFRAADQLVWPALEGFHPLVLGRPLAGADASAELERRVGLDMLHPLPAGEFADPRAAEAVGWFAGRLRSAVWSAFTALDVDPNRYDTPPRPDDPTSAGYCPRCDGQFVRATGTCSACGIALRSFADPPPAPATPPPAPPTPPPALVTPPAVPAPVPISAGPKAGPKSSPKSKRQPPRRRKRGR